MSSAPFRKRIRKRFELGWQEAAICRRVAGPTGLLASLSRIVFGYPEQLLVKLEGLRHPLCLRLQTSDAQVCDEVLFRRVYSFPVSFPPRTIVDAGANCGITSVFYANQFPQATIWAIEPEPSNYAALIKNAKQYPNIIPIRAALWSEDGEVELCSPAPKFQDWGKWGFAVRSGRGCRAFTIHTLMQEMGVDGIDILKIDIEGAEREIFSDTGWVDRVRLLAIELHDRTHPGCTAAVDAAAGSRKKIQKELVTFYY
jgi:FkbM family methyltransferase